MLVLILRSPEFSDENRDTVARILTLTAAYFADTDPAMVQIYFGRATLTTLDVHAVGRLRPGAADALRRALEDHIDPTTAPFVRMYTYPYGHMAKGGTLQLSDFVRIQPSDSINPEGSA